MIPNITNSQEGFRFLNQNKKTERIRFKFINNLIVIPLKINGKKLSFILDSGVSKTILFNITQNDSIGLNSVEKVSLRGLGKGEPVEALLSKNNKLSLKNIVSYDETIYVIVRDYFDLSSKMGTTIHGIIGYNLLSNYVVKINYKNRYIDFYDPENYELKRCRKCETFPLNFYRKKPFIDAKVQLDTIGDKLTDVKLLIDSGGSDAIWLFEHTKPEIVTPINHFNDILGEGLSGSIYGNRSRISTFKLGSFIIEQPTVSFLDSISTKNARMYKERNGSIGSNILKRFIVWFNYANNTITFKKNGSFKKGFNYNMSGLDVVYNGKQLVKEEDVRSYSDAYNQSVSSTNSVKFITSFSYKFKPSYRIRNIVANSPADKAGLKVDDIILRLNNKPAHEYQLGEIIQKFQEKDGKRIKITVDRKGEKLKFQFRLEKKV
uniref:aspartyl protease family protein n=1 Tax=uncultured Polaribacter sp. TaxID=174711 RepID=UPI00260E115E|nr:aspartyl protease family protein [uncultured Polaribacter sp.]